MCWGIMLALQSHICMKGGVRSDCDNWERHDGTATHWIAHIWGCMIREVSLFQMSLCRYIVHPKLVNFCAPTPYIVPPEMVLDVDTLLKSLFS